MQERLIKTLINDTLQKINLSDSDKQLIHTALESKQIIEVAGTILEITNAKDGVSCITIRDLDGNEHMLCHPSEMTDSQFNEFKRAQNHGLKVVIFYCIEDGDKDLIEVTIRSPS